MLTATPLDPAFRIPPRVPVQSMIRDLVIVTAPKPPESRQLISPLAAVLLMAPAKVLQGAVRLQGLASSPTPETQVRVACADAAALKQHVAARRPAVVAHRRVMACMSKSCVILEAGNGRAAGSLRI